MVYLYQYFKEWHKNPQWSFSCCLALLLPLNDLQGEIHRMAGTNVLETQLQTEETEKPSIFACVKDSGALDINLTHEEDKFDDENTMDLQEQNCNLKCQDTATRQNVIKGHKQRNLRFQSLLLWRELSRNICQYKEY